MMAEGHSKSMWGHTSHVLALIANVNRDRKKRSTPFTSQDFNPHAARKETREPIAQVNMMDLKDMYLGQGIPVKTIKASDIKLRVYPHG